MLVRGHWSAAVGLPGLGDDLLDGLAIQHAEAFESWLLSERRRLAAATESILHEAALGLLARGDLDRARDLAVRAAVMSPLDENHQALLIRLYRLAGEDEAAQRQYDAWASVAAAGARGAARRPDPARDAGGTARRRARARPPRSRR